MSTLFEKSFHGRNISLVDDEEAICFSESAKHYFASIYNFKTEMDDVGEFKICVSATSEYFSEELWENLMTGLRRTLAIGKLLLPSMGLKPMKVWMKRRMAHERAYQEPWEREMTSRLRKFGSVDYIITTGFSRYGTSFVDAYRSACGEKFCYRMGIYNASSSRLAARISVQLMISKNEFVPTIQEVIEKVKCTKKDYDGFSLPFTMEVIKYYLKAAKKSGDSRYKELVYSNKKLEEICRINW